MHSHPELFDLGYLVAAGLFILGIKKLGSPRTAPLGNTLSATGMLLAVLITLVKLSPDSSLLGWELMAGGLALGGLIGIILARRVQMTEMPEMVGLLNGFGGAASALVALAEILPADLQGVDPLNPSRLVFLGAIAASSVIGWVTFSGSLVAVLKLHGTLAGNSSLPLQGLLKGLLGIACLALSVLLLLQPGDPLVISALISASTLLGIVIVIPIGGADMPVVVSLLNSLSGVAAAATGFVVNNSVLIIGGSLVGAAGLILTQIMCRAMNRSLMDVLFKSYGGSPEAASQPTKSVVGYESEEAAVAFDGARNVIIVPGYGMAVAQAQYSVRELELALRARGTEVKYAIHPVAGRMPGQMNVLLAEAHVPYEQLYDLEEINDQFTGCDVAVVVGANDTVNPAARQNDGGPLAGMPILNVDCAATVMVVKRSLSVGYAGVDNELFYRPSTMMLFGDAKQQITELASAVRNL